MSTQARPVSGGYHTVTPYLIIRDAAQALEFYKKIFQATERMRMPSPQGKIVHAELQIGDSVIMMTDECPEMNHKSPQTIGGTPMSLYIHVQDVDATVQAAVKAGAILQRPVENQFYGDRVGTLQDPFGHIWSVATRVEDVSPEEMQKRAQKMFAEAR